MNILKSTLLATVATVVMTASSFAFEGFSIGITANDASFDTSGKELKGIAGGASESTAAKKSNDVDFGSGFVEYSFAQGSTLGVSYIPGEASLGAKTRTQTQTRGQTGSGVITAKAEVSDHMTFYVEPTYMLTDTFGVYVKGGASRVTVKSLENDTGAALASTYGDQDVYGTMTGVGAKLYYGSFFAKLEHTETEYGTVTLISSTGNKNTITADIENSQTAISLGYNF
jgi:hypothetical protein